MSPNNLREHKLKSTSPIPSSSGVEARRWRKQLAATARRSDDTIRTLKFPLEIERPEQYWPAAQALHATVASDAEGSLIHYLYVLLLNGFRVFGKQAETESFRNQAVLDDAGWLQSMGEEAGWKFMDGLHENIGAYLHSGSAPCVQAARGERTGLGEEHELVVGDAALGPHDEDDVGIGTRLERGHPQRGGARRTGACRRASARATAPSRALTKKV